MPRLIISKFTLVLPLLALLTLAANAGAPTPVPTEGPTRLVAAWEPVDTVLVRWPPAHPPIVYTEIDEAASLTFLVANNSQRDAAIGYCSSLGIPESRLNFVFTGQVSLWPRDWGPYCVFTDDGAMVLADPLWNGYPYAGQYCATPTGNFTPNNPADATANATVAAALGLARTPLTFYATGGNLLSDGHGRAFSSCLMVSENLPLMTEAQLKSDAQAQMGVTDWTILSNWETYGIQHVDCWAKWVDEETVLVKRPPPGHPETAPTEANVALLESMTTPWGNPYTIIRVDTPPYSGNNLANYLNSYIVNDRVLVPTFGIGADEAALQIYRDAMPGYRVVGVPHAGFYNHTDAVHCRVRSIHDREMLRIAHPRIRADQPLNAPIEARAFIDDRSDAGVIDSATNLLWRERGLLEWRTTPLPLAPAHGPRWRAAFIDAMPSPTEIEYYIDAADNSGRRAFMPPVGAHGPQRFLATDGGLRIVPLDLPAAVAPGAAPGAHSAAAIRIDPGADTLDPGSVTAHLRPRPGAPITDIPMQPDANGDFTAALPAFDCADAPELHFTAATTLGAQRRWPALASTAYAFPVVEPATTTLLAAAFDSPTLPDGFTATGLWTITQSCPPPGDACGAPTTPGAHHAAFVDTNSCTYNTGQTEAGDLTRPPGAVAPAAVA
ncbi:MAG: hypothetical protein EA379_10560, partial [Phycisphaerales bacterium]